MRLTDDYILFRKPLELYNLKTGDSKLFKSMEEVYSQSINESQLGDMISKMTLETILHAVGWRAWRIQRFRQDKALNLAMQMIREHGQTLMIFHPG